MEKIDRLGWAEGLTITSYGVTIGIRVSHRAIVGWLRGFLPPHSERAGLRQIDRLYSLVASRPAEPANVRRFNVLYANAARIARTMDLDQALKTLESDLQLYVAEHARQRIFVHAGVVAWRGYAIVIPGSSFSGKSTLVAALVRAGATYYSDEYAIFDRSGRVHPYPKPLTLRANGDAPGRRPGTQPSGNRVGRLQPETLAPACNGVRPLRVGAVIATTYHAGAQWQPRALSRGQAVMALLAHTVSARRRPQQALAVLSKAVSRAVAQKSVRGEAEEMVASLLSQAGEPLGPISSGTSDRRSDQRWHA